MVLEPFSSLCAFLCSDAVIPRVLQKKPGAVLFLRSNRGGTASPMLLVFASRAQKIQTDKLVLT